jgi:hypothetical protein
VETRSGERKKAFYDVLHGDEEGVDRITDKAEEEMALEEEEEELVESMEEEKHEGKKENEEETPSTATPLLPLTSHFSITADDPSHPLPALEDDAEAENLPSTADDSGVFLPNLSAFVDDKDDEKDDDDEESQLPSSVEPGADSGVIVAEDKHSPIGEAPSDVDEDDLTLAVRAPVIGRGGSENGEKKRSREEDGGAEEKKGENGGEKKKKKKNRQHKKSKKAKKEKGGVA